MDFGVEIAEFDSLESSYVTSHAPVENALYGDVAIKIGREAVGACGNGRDGNCLGAGVACRVKYIIYTAFKTLNHQFVLILVLVPIRSNHMHDALSICHDTSGCYGKATHWDLTKFLNP